MASTSTTGSPLCRMDLSDLSMAMVASHHLVVRAEGILALMRCARARVHAIMRPRATVLVGKRLKITRLMMKTKMIRK